MGGIQQLPAITIPQVVQGRQKISHRICLGWSSLEAEPKRRIRVRVIYKRNSPVWMWGEGKGAGWVRTWFQSPQPLASTSSSQVTLECESHLRGTFIQSKEAETFVLLGATAVWLGGWQSHLLKHTCREVEFWWGELGDKFYCGHYYPKQQIKKEALLSPIGYLNKMPGNFNVMRSIINHCQSLNSFHFPCRGEWIPKKVGSLLSKMKGWGCKRGMSEGGRLTEEEVRKDRSEGQSREETRRCISRRWR